MKGFDPHALKRNVFACPPPMIEVRKVDEKALCARLRAGHERQVG